MELNKFSDFLSQKPQGFLIVGLGASAGGIGALKVFFEHVPEDSHIAYVVILHLSPDHDSQLAQVLQAVTSIPVTQVTEKVKIEPDHIYVVPPNQHLIMEGDFIAPSINLYMEERRAPVDIFFRTLADSHGPRAISVILSGTGANGSMGLKRVKERGGAAYVQNPREAEFNEMPRNAIATELIDQVLPVAEIPGHILAYRNSLGNVAIALEPQQRPELQQQALREIFTQLRLRTGHDFSNYKRPTLLRRIERRINVLNLPDLTSYAAFLQQNVEENHALLKDLLISVTNFFRDKKPFQALEQKVLPALFQDNNSEDEVRIWVAGCATGEEAYSLAMLVAERTWGVIDAPKVQLFATDIDEAAITVAREGLYTLNDAADVSPERLQRFFQKEGDSYRITREIREMILFANHNFLKDPPFSRLDLVSCRNVLIYLNSTAQERVMETFHFALKPGSYLFLGSSESVDGATDLYTTVSREHHIYQARQATLRHYPMPESVPQLQPRQLPAVQTSEVENRTTSRISFGELHQKLLEQYAAPSLVVNEAYDIVHLSEKVGSFLEFSGGEPTKNLLKLIKPELRLELRSALYQAMQHQTATEARSVGWTQNGEQQWLNIHVKPVTKEGDPAKGFLLVIFEPHTQEQSPEKVVLTADEPIALQLEEELIGVKAQLRLRAEQYEYQAEELKASNEELQAMNEELRTVNQELKVKIEEISLTSDNLQNLINSADVATIFLDRGFCTRLYTPATRQIFNLNPSDYGRPISDITHRLEYSHLLQDAQTVLEKLSVLEREVTTRDQQTFMMRILPYRTTDDRINGVVITFFDITKRKQTENALLHSEERLRLLIESARDYAIYMLDTERRVISWSSGAQGIFGYTEAEIIGKSGDIVFLPEDRNQQVPEWEAETAEKEGRAENERWHLRKDGSRFWGSGLTQPLTDEEGNTIGFVKILRNLTDTKRLEEAKFFLAAIVETSNDSIITIDFQRNITSWNKAAQHLYGYTAQEAIGKNLTLLTLPEDLSGILNNVDAIEHSREVLIFDTVRHTKEGQRIHLEIVMSPVLNPLGEVIGISTIARNVSERKRREANLAFLAKINLDFAPLLTVQDVMEPIGEQLAAYLQLSGCHFSMVDEEHDRLEVIYQYRQDETLAGIRGVHRLSDTFTQEGSRCLGAGKLAVTSTAVDNLLVKTPTHTLKQLSFGLRVDVPHLEGGRWRFLLTVGRAEMGEWRSDELELLQELAAKIYIRLERAKAEEALRKSQQQLQQLNESLEKQVSEHTQALRNSRDMLQSVFDTTLLSLSILKAVRDERGTITDFQILLVNKELERETGRNDLVGKLYVAEYPGIRQVGVFDLMAQVMETGEQGQLEFYYPHENFNKWYSAMFVKLEDGLVASSLDITERKLAEAELTRNFTILKQAEEVAGMGSWEYNMASNSFSWSEGMYRLFGLPVGTSIRPEIYLDYVIAQDRPIAEKIIHTLSSGQEPLEETLRISVNGQVVTLKIKASVLTDETGKPVKMLGVDIDMSKVKQLEQENLKMRLEQQQQLLHAILEAQEEERRRISESLHNGVGQILYATKLNLERMDYEEQPGGEKEWQEALNTASELLSEAIVETRRVSHELVPVLLKEFGLEEAVADFCQRFTGQGLQLHYQVRGIEGRLESHMELALYRLSQELINNIIKHAGATQASLLLEKREGEIRLEVSDNGKGFDPEQVRQKGIGLKTMQDRVELLGGKLILASQDGQGTQISILIPL